MDGDAVRRFRAAQRRVEEVSLAAAPAVEELHPADRLREHFREQGHSRMTNVPHVRCDAAGREGRPGRRSGRSAGSLRPSRSAAPTRADAARGRT